MGNNLVEPANDGYWGSFPKKRRVTVINTEIQNWDIILRNEDNMDFTTNTTMCCLKKHVVTFKTWKQYTLQETKRCGNDRNIDHPHLVGGLEHFLFFHILGTIIPTDELIFFRGVGGSTTNQPYIPIHSHLNFVAYDYPQGSPKNKQKIRDESHLPMSELGLFLKGDGEDSNPHIKDTPVVKKYV